MVFAVNGRRRSRTMGRATIQRMRSCSLIFPAEWRPDLLEYFLSPSLRGRGAPGMIAPPYMNTEGT